MRAHICFCNVQTVAFQDIQQMTVYFVHIGLRTQPFGDALLVGDDEDPSEILDNEWDGYQEIFPNLQFGNLLDVVANQLHVDDPVAIQK